jgi:hypothetical protein
MRAVESRVPRRRARYRRNAMFLQKQKEHLIALLFDPNNFVIMAAKRKASALITKRKTDVKPSGSNAKRKAAAAPAARQVRRKIVTEELKPVHHPSHGTVSICSVD